MCNDNLRGKMQLFETQSNSPKDIITSSNYECDSDKIISNEECRKYLGKYNLTDERILAIKDNLIGIVDSILNAYLEDFKYKSQ